MKTWVKNIRRIVALAMALILLGASVDASAVAVYADDITEAESNMTVSEDDAPGYKATKSGDTGTIVKNECQTADFNFNYSASGSAEIYASVGMEGAVLKEEFLTFEMFDENPDSATYGEVIATAKNGVSESNVNEQGGITSAAIVAFPALEYTHEDAGKTFQYSIRMVDEEKPGYTYDDAVYNITVSVTDDGNGTLTITAVKEGVYDVTVSTGENLAFQCYYEAYVEVALCASVTLDGRNLAADDFSFQLWDSEDNMLQTTTNNGDGTINFDVMRYDQNDVGKTFSYYIKQVNSEDETIYCDSFVKEIRVTLSDNGDGTLSVSIVGEAFFENVIVPQQNEDGAYCLNNARQLLWFAEQVNARQTSINAKLTEDIDMNGIDWTIMSSFAGTFDGNGYTIEGLNGHVDIEKNKDVHGFIRTITGDGIVKNVIFKGANVFNHNEGNGAISAVIAYTNEGAVENCVVSSSNIHHGDYDALGVVVGVNGGEIRNCASVSNTMKRRHSSQKAVCGFVWENTSGGTIENCFNYDCTYQNGTEGYYAFTQSNTGTIANCYYYESSETLSDAIENDVIEVKSADQFASGEVAYLLNGSKSEGTLTWGQDLKTNVYPVYKNNDNTVYYGYANCYSKVKTYSNVKITDEIPDHVWKYETDDANTNKMTFSCTTDGCTKGGTITVTAPVGATYNGNNHTATVSVETEGNEQLIETPEITYSSLTEGVELVDGKPVNAGTYEAEITCNQNTASVSVTIAPKTLEVASATAIGRTYNGTNTVEISEMVFNGLVGSDVIAADSVQAILVNDDGTEANGYAGEYRCVKFSEITLIGDKASNYVADLDAEKVELTSAVTISKAAKAPNMPEATRSVSYSQKTVDAVTLPKGWVWSDADSAKDLTVDKVVEATAIYNGADKGSYVTESVTVSITRRACTHTGATEVKNTKASTCKAEGYTGDTYCKGCGAKTASGKAVSKLAHTWNTGAITKKATATKKGEKTYTCKVCKATKIKKIPALGVPKKGTTAKSGKATYKVTKSDLKYGTVSYVAPTSKKATTVIIPETVKIDGVTFKVTAIEKNAFKNNIKVKKVTIGKNVTTIGDNAFYKCTALTKISVPSKVKTIGKNAFYGCSKMTSATIGKSVSKIGSKAFYGCSKLKTLTIKSSKLTAKKIGSKAFSKTPKSMKVIIPKAKFKVYKSMLIGKGVNKKATFKKG